MEETKHESTMNILTQFQNLQQSGMLSSVENLKKENTDLIRIVNDISHLISLTQVDSMIDFLCSRFLEYFIPDRLVFLFQPPRKKHLRQYVYRRLVKSDECVSTDCFSYLKDYFDENLNQEQSGAVHIFSNIKDSLPVEVTEETISEINPYFVIPLIGIGGTYGIVFISNKITDSEYTDSQISYISRIFSILSITMQNGLHYESSITDSKTGLYTNDFFFQHLNATLSSVKRYKQSAAVLILDIDFFKKFNDTWGHLLGDKVLVSIANTLKKTLRNEDCIARFGGEEFSVLLSQCTQESVFKVAERIRMAIEDMVIYENNTPLKVTVSIGGVIIDYHENLEPRIIFKKADLALYYSKEHGRNRSTIFKLGLLDLAKMRNNDFDFVEEE
ncbi:GGDEF domain-containing protein [Treponema sp.]|uniref:GGDEF domain-containing protein n=1 Tax=Treponema sp. TaxID=166 RepID=UPI00298E90F1|nr:GGDEF domain-containing protein [Treponema sp.]MCQ2242251.1 GGDEF domain-containing protein [Treponema sp.]